MKSLLRYISNFKISARNKLAGGNHKSRKSSSVSDTSYQPLEQRNLLTTFTVTTLQDSVANDGLVSLREAVTAANANAAFRDAAAGNATGDRIRFANSLLGQTIQLTAGDLRITDDLQIVGDITLDAQNQFRIISIDTSENVALSRLTFINGQRNNQGGAIEVIDGNLQISQARFQNLSTTGFSSQGGAIYSSNSNVRIGRSTFVDNISERGGAIAGIDSNINVFQSTFIGNEGVTVSPTANSLRGAGGAIEARGGRLSVVESTFSGNNSPSGGAIFFSSSDNLFISKSTFDDNSAIFGGGVNVNFSNRAVILESEFIENRGVFGGGLAAEGTVFVTDSLFEGNIVERGPGTDLDFRVRAGGGIFNEGELFVSNSRILGNSSDEVGGGIALRSGGIARISDSLISGNEARLFGGGISSEQSDVYIIDSTVSSNSVTLDRPFLSRAALGGGLFAVNERILPDPRSRLLEGTGTPSDSLVFISNSNFDSNRVDDGGAGVATLGVSLSVVDSSFRDNVNLTPQFSLQPLNGVIRADFTSGGGGAIWHGPNAGISKPLSVDRSEFRGNEATIGPNRLASIPISGGAIAIRSSEALIRESEFFGNHSDVAGGAIGVQSDTQDSSVLRLVDNVFVGNSAGGNPNLPDDFSPFIGRGGAVYADFDGQSSVPFRIFGGEFRGNFATHSGGAIFAASSTPQDAILLRANSDGEGTRFINNTALRLDGGAIATDGIGLNARDAFFSTNTARNGGAIFLESGDELRLVFSEFRRNAARSQGGAVSYFDTVFIDFESVLANNTAVVGPDFFERT